MFGRFLDSWVVDRVLFEYGECENKEEPDRGRKRAGGGERR
jgi:hypothetical protein